MLLYNWLFVGRVEFGPGVGPGAGKNFSIANYLNCFHKWLERNCGEGETEFHSKSFHGVL